MTMKNNTKFSLNYIASVMFMLITLDHFSQLIDGQSCKCPQEQGNTMINNRVATKPNLMKDVFPEDYSFLGRVRTTHDNLTLTCNAVLVSPRVVLTDVYCMRYRDMGIIDSKYIEVFMGEANEETIYKVEHTYIYKADPNDSSTELALLKLHLHVENNLVGDSVRALGYINNIQIKEQRNQVTQIKDKSSRHIGCTSLSDVSDTPGNSFLRGGALFRVENCKFCTLMGFLTQVNQTTTLKEMGSKKRNDCYIMMTNKLISAVETIATLI